MARGSLEECLAMCESDSQCKSVDYDTTDGHCCLEYCTFESCTNILANCGSTAMYVKKGNIYK